ncbi:pullulanase-type alpha-1,6-glucosidase [Paucibacter sp. APW11]|uniref:Pullulanase-type alpha-1,6-glucosidase n=1 Tax=Roseateles aquae TaxID=3077235 RepID=A0ABU3P956_9BURK|nr:pullulanase-type alpha-1,6-glucosidase [Paucibacter sp. APW11]MDT8998261.1 pullulanase-type alpha-1,6-glucosidase [Paucibacter sp. APW11]
MPLPPLFSALTNPGNRLWRRWLLLLASGVTLAAQGAVTRALAADCDDPAPYRLLQAQADPAEVPAAAYWVGIQHLQWPGVSAKAESRFVLYASRTAGLRLRVGERPGAADLVLPLQVDTGALPPELTQRFAFLKPGVRLRLAALPRLRWIELMRAQQLLAELDPHGRVLRFSALQLPGALDEGYRAADDERDFGAQIASRAFGGAERRQSRFRLWAPTAQRVALCRYADAEGPALAVRPLRFDASTGAWHDEVDGDASGQYYRYLVDVFVPGLGLVRNRVTDPYSVSLNADSRRSYIADLNAPALQPPGWTESRAPQTVARNTDMVVYELHVRDFSISDASVPPAARGKYLAFAEPASAGMRHLQALARSGVTDLHLLPVFDIASVPERGCSTPQVPRAAPDSEAQQAAVMAEAARDCFNWGYDPLHYGAPEGSYASDANDGARRIIEFRQMVMGLHAAGLRVGMDLVYNHTAAAGQQVPSVLDRIVPGYYQRLDWQGRIERSTCCDNTATEHRMMAKLTRDTVLRWQRDYKISSFRFDLMAHQPRALMEALQRRLDAQAGQHVPLIGEGWNFGEVANGARFVQASQLSLNGSGIATFSDRGRDALRGGSAGDSGAALFTRQGWLNGLSYAPNESVLALSPQAQLAQAPALLASADQLRVALAGSLRDFEFEDASGSWRRTDAIPYGDQPAGYVSEPGEVVNYAENHDNQTLFDLNVMRLPRGTPAIDRARVQALGAAVVAFSQGVAYFHAGQDLLRSKSLDRNSYDSGDWFNRLDWTLQDNHFGSGLPPRADNGADHALLAPLLRDPAVKPGPEVLALASSLFRELLALRASSSLFRLPTAAEVRRRLRFHNTGPGQNPALLVGQLMGQFDGETNEQRWPGAAARSLLYLLNASPAAQTLQLDALRGQPWRLHPLQAAGAAADPRVSQEASFDAANGRFKVPGRSAVVFSLD